MKHSFLLLVSILLLSGLAPAAAQINDSPEFNMSDTLGVYGPWKTTLHATVRGKQKNVPISISYRYKILGKRMATCRFTMEFRNDTDKKLKFMFLAGNDRTNGFQGSIGTTREKIDLDPKERKELTYMMPSKGFKDDGGAATCKWCRELDHHLFFGDLEAK